MLSILNLLRIASTELVFNRKKVILTTGLSKLALGGNAVDGRTERRNTGSTLGSYLASIRVAKGLTLRQVEQETGRKVSNAYLSQLEHGRISRPSPNILYSLAKVYGVAYNLLMKKAGYIVAKGTRKTNESHGRVATFAIENLTPKEEDELLDYLAYIRSRKGRRGTKPDNSKLAQRQYVRVRTEALNLLQKADAFGTFPTPVTEIMDVANVMVEQENILDEEFLCNIRWKAGSALRTAVSKVIGLFDAKERLVFIDRSVHSAKQNFIKLHETGHAMLPWQQNLYEVIEDSKQELDPDTAELFDREANMFATEVLFQNDGFIREAVEQPFNIKVPIDLSQKYGASIYASVRQYVEKNPNDCILLVLNEPERIEGIGLRVNLRRTVSSPSFQKKFGDLKWSEYFTSGDEIGSMLPIDNRHMSEPHQIGFVDRNGTRHECFAETFTNTYQNFILIHSVRTLTNTTVFFSTTD